MPADWSAAKRAQKDVEARWTQKHGKSYYGYKLHANTNRRWGFIRQIDVTTASVNDTTVFESLLDDSNTSRVVYADRGYAKRAGETDLHVQGYRACIQRKGTAQQPISKAQQRRNHRIARQRAFGEHPFARVAQMGGKHLRTIGLARAKVVMGLKVITHNLMHSGTLAAARRSACMRQTGRQRAIHHESKEPCVSVVSDVINIASINERLCLRHDRSDRGFSRCP